MAEAQLTQEILRNHTATEADLGYLADELPVDEPPVQEVVLKVHQRCNIACDYCYMYELADKSYVTRPNEMSDEIVQDTAMALGPYASLASIPSFLVVFHGGEPLLRKPEFFNYAATTIRETLSSVRVFRGTKQGGAGQKEPVSVNFGVQTNATRITDEHLEVFARHGIQVGVSLDGDAEANNRHRIRKGGGGTYEAVEAGIRRMTDNPKFKDLFGSILCVVDPRNDPIGTYQTLRSFGPKAIDWQLPLGNWMSRPPFREDNTLFDLDAPVPTPYADWLIPVFNLWFEDKIKDPTTPSIPYFETIVRALGSLKGGRETTGGVKRIGAFFIETDGSIHLVDSLKSTKENLTSLGVTIGKDTNLAQVHMLASSAMRRLGGLRTPAPCTGCDVIGACGGGYPPNGYSEIGGQPRLDMPSVYHPDLYKLIKHIGSKLFRESSASPKTVRWVTLGGDSGVFAEGRAISVA